MNRLLIYFLSLTLGLAVASCNNISEDERLIYVPPAEVSKPVLIEDFTGQRCINCPTAAKEIEDLQRDYGDDKIIAVSIHSGPLAVYPNQRITGLRTQLCDDYYDHWQVDAEPMGLINRSGGIVSLEKWRAKVTEALHEQSTMTLDLSATVGSSQKDMNISLKAQTPVPFSGKMQLWILEDSIVAPQMMPDGTMNMSYTHRHVLRATVNGEWGTDVNWEAGNYPLTFSADIEDGWNEENLAVVAFAYDEQGVKQVVMSKLKGK